MPTDSIPKKRLIRMKVEDLPPRSPEHMAELAALSARIDSGDFEPDLSDIPEVTFENLVYRDAAGDFPGRSFIREAVVAAMLAKGWTAYRLHKKAKVYRPTLSLSATNEFVKGERNVGILYVEAMMKALGLGVVSVPVAAAKDSVPTSQQSSPAAL